MSFIIHLNDEEKTGLVCDEVWTEKEGLVCFSKGMSKQVGFGLIARGIAKEVSIPNDKGVIFTIDFDLIRSVRQVKEGSQE